VTAAAASFEWIEPGFRLAAGLVPWDTEVFGFPVAQVHEISVQDPVASAAGWRSFGDWVSAHEVGIVSCRLAMDRLRESFQLEAHGFRFVEVVLHPHRATLDDLPPQRDGLGILQATDADLPGLIGIAERAFRHERYHVDPRLDPRLGERRYARWVRTSLGHPSQQLLKVVDGARLVGFFVGERRDAGAVYWHLNAVAPEHHGQGYGRRAWQAMLHRHRDEGATSVTTTISVRNVAVQNLYAQLGFRFLPPEMTFHWVRGDE
jgi:RimJ/RimL family protein N-acetyltransferase